MKKKLLFVITKSNYGGAQRYVFDLANSYKEEYDVVVALGGNGSLKEKLAHENVRTITIPSLERNVSFKKEFLSFFELLRIIQQEKPDILHLNSSKASGLGALAGRILNVPKIVVTAHAWAFNEDRPWYQKLLIRLLHGITVYLSNTTICVSNAVRLGLTFPFTAHKMKTVHLGVRTDEPLLERVVARTKLSVLSGAPVEHRWIITIAELHQVKGLTVAIEAISTLPQEPETNYIIIGEGEMKEELQKIIFDKKLSERVHLVGFVPYAGTCLRAADVFLLPSFSEALGYVLLEAGLASIPVIATSVGGIPEVIIDNETGLLVPPRDAHAIGEALSKDLSTYGTALTAKVKNEFSLERMVRETREIYEA